MMVLLYSYTHPVVFPLEQFVSGQAIRTIFPPDGHYVMVAMEHQI